LGKILLGFGKNQNLASPKTFNLTPHSYGRVPFFKGNSKNRVKSTLF